MSIPTPPVDRAEGAAAAPAPTASTAPGAEPDPTAEPAREHDVRSGGDARHAPRSLTAAEARWQEHDSSGAPWDNGESI